MISPSATSMRTRAIQWAMMVGLLLMMVAALLPLLTDMVPWMRYLFATGAALVLLSRLAEGRPARGTSLRLRRLRWLGTVSALLYCAAAAMTFLREGTTDWVAFLMAGAVMQAYVGFMTDRELAAAARQDHTENR